MTTTDQERREKSGDLLGLLANLTGNPETLGDAATKPATTEGSWAPRDYIQEGIGNLATAVLSYADATGADILPGVDLDEQQAVMEGAIVEALRLAASKLTEDRKDVTP